MHPRCQFCYQSVSKVCFHPKCSFNPFICDNECVSKASRKVHFHQAQSQLSQSHNLPHIITIQQLYKVIQLKKSFDYLDAVLKSKTRLVERIEKMTEEFIKFYQSTFFIDPNIEQMIKKLEQSNQSLSGKDIKYLIQCTFYNPQNPRNKLVAQLSKHLDEIYQKTSNTLNKYLSFDQREKAADNILKQSRLLANQGSFLQSIALLKKGAQINPLNTEILYQISDNFEKLGKFKQSISNYNNIIEFYPESRPQAYNKIGDICFSLSQFQKSLQYYSKAIQLDNSTSDYYYDRGNLLSCLKRNQQSVEDFTRAIQLKPNNPKYLYKRGIMYKELKKYQHSYLDFLKAAELRNHPDYINNRDQVLEILRKNAQQKFV